MMAQSLDAVFKCHETLGNRALPATENGYLGSVKLNPTPGEYLRVSPGDQVFVLLGCSWPVVLNEVNGGYRLIGKAYVHGIMNGEAVFSHHEQVDSLPLKDITLL